MIFVLFFGGESSGTRRKLIGASRTQSSWFPLCGKANAQRDTDNGPSPLLGRIWFGMRRWLEQKNEAIQIITLHRSNAIFRPVGVIALHRHQQSNSSA